jgi:hypothetical protein
MRIMIRPSSCPNLPVDVTSPLVATLAAELSRLQPGGEANWREAEMLLEQIAGRPVAGPCAPGISGDWHPRPQPHLFSPDEEHQQAAHRRAARGEEIRFTEDSTADWPVR